MAATIRWAACVLMLVVAVAPVRAVAANYDEGIDGDLSGTVGSPTSLGTLGVGSHNLVATSGAGDFDLLTFSIAPGTSFDSLVLGSYSGPSVSFAGMQIGSVWTEGLGAAINAPNLLGWAHFGGAQVGTDILDDIGAGAGAAGFGPPLGPGDYTMLLQDTGGSVNYGMTFVVTPEPATLLMAAMGLVCLAGFCMRRRDRAARRG